MLFYVCLQAARSVFVLLVQLKPSLCQRSSHRLICFSLTGVAIENMTPAEFRDRLKGMGVTTRVRNIKKLQQMCINAMEAAV